LPPGELISTVIGLAPIARSAPAMRRRHTAAIHALADHVEDRDRRVVGRGLHFELREVLGEGLGLELPFGMAGKVRHFRKSGLNAE
jgi:hypothetical protein